MADLAELGILVKFQDPQNAHKQLKDIEVQAKKTSEAANKLKSAGKAMADGVSKTTAATKGAKKGYAELRGEINKLSAAFKGVADTPKGLRDLETNLKQVDTAAKKAYESGKLSLDGYKRLAQQSDTLSARIKTQISTLQKNASQYLEADNAAKQYIQTLKQQQAAQNNLARNKEYEASRKRELQRLRDDIQLRNKVAESYQKHDAAAQQYNKTLQNQNKNAKAAATQTNRLAEAFDKVYTRVKQFASFIAAATILMTLRDAFRATIDAIKEFDQALYSLQAITGATATESKVLGDRIRDIARDTKFSAGEVAAGMELIGKAGFNAAESLRIIKPVADLATGSLEEFDTVASLVVTSIRAFQLETVEAGRAADVFANAVTNSKLNIDSLATAFGYVGAAGNQAGLTLEEVTGTLMVLADNGIRASTMGTGLRRMILGLLSPNENLSIALRNVGLQLEDIDPKTAGWETTLRKIAPLMWDFETNTVDMGKAVDFFGLRASQVAAILIRETAQGGALSDAIESTKEMGAAARMAALQQEGLGIKFKNLADRAKNVALALGDAGATSAIGSLIDKLRDGAEAVEMFLKKSPESAQFAAWATGVGTVTVAVIALTTALKYAKLAVVAVVSPWSLLIGAIAGGLTAISYFRNRLDKLSEAHEKNAIAVKENVEVLKSWQKVLEASADKGEQEYNTAVRRFAEENKELAKRIIEVANAQGMFENATVSSMDQIIALSGSMQEAEKNISNLFDTVQIEKAKEELNSWVASLETAFTKISKIERGGKLGITSSGMLGEVAGGRITKEAQEEIKQVTNIMEDQVIAVANSLYEIGKKTGKGYIQEYIQGLLENENIAAETVAKIAQQVATRFELENRKGAELAIKPYEEMFYNLPEKLSQQIKGLNLYERYGFENEEKKIRDSLNEIYLYFEKQKNITEEQLDELEQILIKRYAKQVDIILNGEKEKNKAVKSLGEKRADFYEQNAEELIVLAQMENDEREKAHMEYQAKMLKLAAQFEKEKAKIIEEGGSLKALQNIFDLRKKLTKKEYKELLESIGENEKKLIQAKIDEIEKMVRTPFEILQEQLAELDNLIAAGLDLETAERAAAIYRERYLKSIENDTKKTLSEIDKMWERVLENVQDNTADVFRDMLDDGEDAWQNFADGIVDIFKDTFAQIAAYYANKYVVLPIVGQMIGGVGGQGAQQQIMSSLSGGGSGGGGKGFTQSLGLSPGGSGILSQTIPGTGNISGGVSWGQALSAAGGAYQIGYNIGNLDTLQGISGTVSGGLKVASAVPGPHQPYTFAASMVLDVLGGIFGGDSSPNDADLRVGFGDLTSPSGGDVLTGEYAQNRAQGIPFGEFGAINVSGDDFLSQKQEQRLERTLNRYFTETFDALGKQFDFSVEEALSQDWVYLHINDLQDYFGEGGGGVQAVISDILDSFFETFTDEFSGAILGEKGRELFDADFLTEIQTEGETLADAFIRTMNVMTTVPDSMRRMRELMEEGHDEVEAFAELEGQLNEVWAILSPAIQQGLNASLEKLSFEDFQAGLTQNLQDQMKQAVIASAQKDFTESIISAAFDEVGSIQDLLGDYFSGDLSLDEFTAQFDLAMDNIENALSTEEFERFTKVLETLGFTAEETTENLDGASNELSEAHQRQLDSMRDSFTDIINTAGMSDYEEQMYRLRQQYQEHRQDLEEMGQLYDDQGRLTDIAAMALAAYNIEVQALQQSLANAINDTKQQIATLGMSSGMATNIDLAAKYGMAPSSISGASGQALLQRYMGASTQGVQAMANAFGVSVEQLNNDMLSLGQSLLEQEQNYANQSATQHSEAQNARREIARSMDQALSSIDSMLNDLTFGSMAPVQSMEAMQNRYNELVEKMRTSDDPGKYASELQSFLPKYMDFAGAYGGDYAELVGTVKGDLEGVYAQIKTERDLLGEIASNTGSTAGSTSSTATNTANFLDLGIPLNFDFSGLDTNAANFLSGLAEIVGMVGWNSQLTLDFVTNYQYWEQLPFDSLMDTLQQAAKQAPDGWHTKAIVDMVTNYEDWNLYTLEQQIEAMSLIADEYGWHSKVVYEFLADIDAASGSIADLMAMLPEDDELQKNIITSMAVSGDFTKAEIENLMDILGTDTAWNVDVLSKMEVSGKVSFRAADGYFVTRIARFGYMSAGWWAKNVSSRLKNIVDATRGTHTVLKHIAKDSGITGYEAGGYHPGGFRLVGEQGPELEFTGPSRIESNESSVDMIAAAVSKALSGSNTNGPIHITLNVDRRQIGKVVIDEMRHNPEFGRQMTKQLKVA